MTGSAARQAASDHPQAAGVQEDWYLPKAAQESSSEAPVDSQPIEPSAEVAPKGLPDIDVDAAPMPAASPAPVLPPEPPAGLPDIDMETPLSGLPDIDMEASPIPAPETPPTLPSEPPAGLPDIDMDLPPPPQVRALLDMDLQPSCLGRGSDFRAGRGEWDVRVLYWGFEKCACNPSSGCVLGSGGQHGR